MPEPVTISHGLSIQNNKNGFTVVRLHYSADDDKQDDWVKRLKNTYISDIWNQEQELDFTKASGKRVYPEFRYDTHVSGLKSIPYRTIWRGWDFGYHHPACVWAQINETDGINILAELLGEEVVINKFADEVKKMSSKLFPGYDFLDAGDPAVRAISDKSQKTTADILRGLGIRIQTRQMLTRDGINIIRNLLLPKQDGSVKLKVDGSCKLVIDGFLGGYTRKEETDEPEKDGYYEHLFDAMRYLAGVVYNCKTYETVRYEHPWVRERKTVSSVAGY